MSHRLGWADGHVRLSVGAASVEVDVLVVHDGRLLVVRELNAARPAPGTLDVRADGLWLSIVDEGDGRWTVGLEAFALAVNHPDDERGDLVPLGLDVELDEGRLVGDLLVGAEVIALDLPATWTTT